MRKGSSKAASALQAKLEGKIEGLQDEIDLLRSRMIEKESRLSTIEEMLEMLRESDTDESEAAA